MEAQTLNEIKLESNIEIIEGIMMANGGYITSKQITELGIHRMYLNIMLEKNMIEKVSKGIYIDKNIIEDVYYTFQLRYPKTIYARFTALYLHNLTEIFPHTFELVADYNYHVEEINKRHSFIKCKKEFLNLGLCEVKTPNGHYVNAYDKERCICDIIKYRKRLDIEQVKKSVKMYVKDNDKNMSNLIKYSKIMGINEEVMEFVGMFYE